MIYLAKEKDKVIVKSSLEDVKINKEYLFKVLI